VKLRSRAAIDIETDELWENKSIARACERALREDIIAALAASGEAFRTSATTCVVVDASTTKTLCDELLALCARFALSGKVMTIAECVDAEGIARGTALAGASEERVAFAARALERAGACATFARDGVLGVKFA